MGSLCHECDFCKIDLIPEYSPMVWFKEGVCMSRLPNFKCENPNSPMFGSSIVGFLGCLDPSFASVTSKSVIKSLLRGEYHRVNPGKCETEFQAYIDSWNLEKKI